MKPLKSGTQDINALQELGRASVQIVHDIKNQLNGLKLYATFLRKRMEKSERPLDEQETIGKLIAGLERAAADMTTLVRYGRPIELRRQPHADLVKILSEVESGEDVDIEAGAEQLQGQFDVGALTEAFKTITSRALSMRPAGEASALRIQLKPVEDQGERRAVIEWHGMQSDDDPFHSFAGSEGLRMSLAAKIIEAHGGQATASADTLLVQLPLEQQR
jgi:signal transduction histidine kinase